MMKPGFLDSGRGAKKIKINVSESSEKGDDVTILSTPAVVDLSKQDAEFPSLETSNWQPTDGAKLDALKPGINSPDVSNSYDNVTGKPNRKSLDFYTLFTPDGNGIDVVVLVESIRAIS
ncbi:hypothetical protein Tco_0049616 [Tanacetum coccineum]